MLEPPFPRRRPLLSLSLEQTAEGINPAFWGWPKGAADGAHGRTYAHDPCAGRAVDPLSWGMADPPPTQEDRSVSKATTSRLMAYRDELLDSALRAPDALAMFGEASRHLRKLVPYDAAVWRATDPVTGLMTAPIRAENLDDEGCAVYWGCELFTESVNLFRDLARAEVPVASTCARAPVTCPAAACFTTTSCAPAGSTTSCGRCCASAAYPRPHQPVPLQGPGVVRPGRGPDRREPGQPAGPAAALLRPAGRGSPAGAPPGCRARPRPAALRRPGRLDLHQRRRPPAPGGPPGRAVHGHRTGHQGPGLDQQYGRPGPGDRAGPRPGHRPGPGPDPGRALAGLPRLLPAGGRLGCSAPRRSSSNRPRPPRSCH